MNHSGTNHHGVGAGFVHVFVKRQSQSNPNVWVSLGDPQPAIATATSR